MLASVAVNGVTAPMCPLQMSMLLNEYLSSADIQEVGTSCVLPPLPLPPSLAVLPTPLPLHCRPVVA